MSGSKEGGLKAAATNKQLYGNDFYRHIGRAGGVVSRGGGFRMGSELARTAGAKGGRISKRRAKDNLD